MLLLTSQTFLLRSEVNHSKLLGGGPRLTGKLCFRLPGYNLYFALTFDCFPRNTILNWPLFPFGTLIIPGFCFKICLCLFCISLYNESLCPSTDFSVFPGLPKCVDYNFFLEKFRPLITSNVVSVCAAHSALACHPPSRNSSLLLDLICPSTFTWIFQNLFIFTRLQFPFGSF